MVKLLGPCLGTSAAGSVGQALTFSTYKGQAYLKRKTQKVKPPTIRQTQRQYMMNWLSSEWTRNIPDVAPLWTNYAASIDLSPQQAFIQLNMKRFSQGKAPSKYYPPDETFPYSIATALPADGYHNVRSLTRDIRVLLAFGQAGTMIWYNTNGSDPWSPTSYLYIATWRFIPIDTVRIPSIPPGVYTPKLIRFSLDGLQSTALMQPPFTVYND